MLEDDYIKEYPINESICAIMNHDLPRSVVFSMNFGILNELSCFNILLDGFDCSKVVVNSVLFAFTRRTRGVGDTETKLVIREAFHEEVDERSFSDARRATKDNGTKNYGRH